MAVVVRKSPLVVVRPSAEPVMTTANIKLSSYDKIFVAGPVTSLLLFEHPIHEPAETIKSALSQALVHYHPISGRLDEDEVHIRCTGEGVSFAAASANCAMKDVKFFPSLLEKLAIYYPAAGGCGRTDPLLMMQVTEFSCGGFIVGVTWNHIIADTTGVGQFLQAVGELARGLSSPSVVPIRWDDSLTGIPRSNIDDILEFGRSLQPFDMALLDITIPSSTINRIKQDFCGHSNGHPCTVFEAVAAVLWQCRTRAIISDPEAPTAFFFAANARMYVGAKDGYYGNCFTSQLAMAMSGAVANGDILDVVKMIRRAKYQVPDQFSEDGDAMNLSKLIQRAKEKLVTDHFSKDLRDSNLKQFGALLGYNLFIVTCWRNLGLDKADFGGGKPARVMCHMQRTVTLPTCVACLPCNDKEGSNVYSLLVKEEHADAFVRELAKFT